MVLLSTNKGLRRKPKSRARRTVKDDKLALEEDITKDREADAGVGLDTAEAGSSRSVNRSVIDVATWHDGLVSANTEGDAGENGAASIGVTTLSGVERGARDLGVVGLDDGGGEVEEGGSGIGDGINVNALEPCVADRVAVACKFPETVA